MPSTSTEDLIKQLKRAKRSSAILVPLIENFMQHPVEIEDKHDRKYLSDLIKARSVPRKAGVYSPSMLADCVRKVYFIKTQVKRQPTTRIDSNGIFLDGNFRHFKWQFVLWKMHKAEIIELIDVGSICLGTEIYVQNEKGDFGGTIDQLFRIPERKGLFTIDYKGMNGNSFLNSIGKGPSLNYIIQSVGYAGLANSRLNLPEKIEKVLILGENKNGAIRNRMVQSPLGLREWGIHVEDYSVLVARRLKTLRAFERKQETPPPACTSTRRVLFKDCPFAPICRPEVEQIERQGKVLRKKKDILKPSVLFNGSRNGVKKRI